MDLGSIQLPGRRVCLTCRIHLFLLLFTGVFQDNIDHNHNCEKVTEYFKMSHNFRRLKDLTMAINNPDPFKDNTQTLRSKLINC